jgi:hypothetical protein
MMMKKIVDVSKNLWEAMLARRRWKTEDGRRGECVPEVNRRQHVTRQERECQKTNSGEAFAVVNLGGSFSSESCM